MAKTIIVRYGEVALKSKPVRRRFERRLIHNINLSLKGLRYKLRQERGRIFIDTGSISAATMHLSKIPGIVSVSPSIKVESTLNSIRLAAVKVARGVLSPGMSFAVRTSRTGEHEFSSRDVNVNVGSAILARIKGICVNLSAPERKIFIEIRGGDAYVFTRIVDGVGGLPIGCQGNVVVLFSGSTNSLAAAYFAMKRGCVAFPLLLDHAGGQMRRLAINSARKLAAIYPRLKLRILPYNKLHRTLVEKATGDLAYTLQRRAELRAAEAVAEQVGGDAIVTDEGLGQITEQGLENLHVIDGACKLMVLRPLVGMNEDEIEQIAHQAGIPKHHVQPIMEYPPRFLKLTPQKVEEMQKIEKELGIDALIEAALPKLKVIRLRRGAWI